MFNIIMFFIIGVSFNVPTIYWIVYWGCIIIDLSYLLYKHIYENSIKSFYRNKMKRDGYIK